MMPRGSQKCSPECKCGKHAFKGPANHKWSDKPTLGAVHQRLKRAFGPAKDYLCNDCDGPAKEWSRIHGRDGLDLDDYEPRCGKCHAKYDYEIVHSPEVAAKRKRARDGYRHSEETKKKISESHSQRDRYVASYGFKGKSHSQESKDLISDSLKNSKTSVLLKRKTGVK